MDIDAGVAASAIPLRMAERWPSAPILEMSMAAVSAAAALEESVMDPEPALNAYRVAAHITAAQFLLIHQGNTNPRGHDLMGAEALLA